MPLLSPAMQSQSTTKGKVIAKLISWDGTDTDGVIFDFTSQGNAMLLREPVCVYIDNTRTTGQIVLSVEGYSYQHVIQPGMSACLPLFSVSLPKVTIKASEGASGLTSVVFCDFMLPNFAYEATGISQRTTDTILEEVVSGGAGSESLRVTDEGAISALGEILTTLNENGNTGTTSDATLKAILAQLKETLAVSDADVLAQLKETLTVSDADVLAQLKETLTVSDADVLAQLKETLTVSDADVLAQLKTTLSVKNEAYSTSQIYYFNNSSNVDLFVGKVKISAITIIPTSSDAENLTFNLCDYPTAVNVPTSCTVACFNSGAVNVPVRIDFPCPLSLSQGAVLISSEGPWTLGIFKNITSAVIFLEVTN